MNQLVSEITKPFLVEETIKRTIVVYPGRFQPAARHHLAVYKWLVKKFGKENVFITTSNIKKPPRHPMNFKEKVRHMVKMGIPSNKIVRERIPYRALNVLRNFNPSTTAVIYVVGKKDTKRLASGKYFLSYKKHRSNLEGYEEHGYTIDAPHVSIKIDGKEISGTVLRKLLGDPDISDEKRTKLFKKAFGYFDAGIFAMLKHKFSKLSETGWPAGSDGTIGHGYPDEEDMERIKRRVRKARDQTDSNPKYQYDITNEVISLPVELGDEILMGRFKNKKVIVKSIDWNEKGDLLVNGRPAMKMRIPKAVKSKDIEEFIQNNDISEIIKETSVVASSAVDDGPIFWFPGFEQYKEIGDEEAAKLGWTVVNYILNTPEQKQYHPDYPDGPVRAVSFGPSGVEGAAYTERNTGPEAVRKWEKHIQRFVKLLGWKLIDQMSYEKAIVKRETKPTDIAVDKEDAGDTEQKFIDEQYLDLAGEIQLIKEGGAYGRMNHPFDDWNLTFKDFKNIIDLGLSGRLNREDNISEKLDGQNIMISWKNGKLIAARNKGHLKNAGKTALTIKGIGAKFKGRGDIRDAFVYAVRDLQKAIGALSEKQRQKVFMDGKAFMNLEVMWPKSANVINYDMAQLVFHGAIEYNKSGAPIGRVKDSARMLEGMIRQVNQHVQKHFKIGKPQFLKISKNQDFGKRKSYYLGKLKKLQDQYSLRDNDTFALYHQRFWEEFIYNAANREKYKISQKVLQGLVQRWAFSDKSYKISDIKKDIENEKFLDWVLNYDKKDHLKQVKQNMFPFETLFMELGAEILKNVSGFIAVNPDRAVQKIKKDLDKAVTEIKRSKDVEKIKKMSAQLKKLEAIGGLDAIVPSEGIVFKYDGRIFKFTGTFGSTNAIIGALKFSR